MTKTSEIARWLCSQDRFAILTHRRPDGDTLGSGALLCRALRQLGKTAHIIKNPEITGKYAHLHEGLTKDAPQAGDVLVCVDVAAPRMLPDAFAALADRIDLRIDHHATATSFTKLELVDPDTSACGEIIYDLMTQMGARLDVPMANALYTAVSTDTGCFRYANTTANTHLVAAACAEAGGDIFAINQALFETNSLGRLRLQGWMTEHSLFFRDNTMVICPITRQTIRDLALTEDDLENISGFPRTISGIQVAATLQEEGQRIKLSVRAVPGYDAAAVCARFGGGGHKGAAGASMTGSMEEAILALKEAMLQLI